MFFQWLKRYVPRGLYSRAALILILPVVTLQLVVSVVFIQRHFEGVTSQMSITTAREIQTLLDRFPSEGASTSEFDGLAQSLAIEIIQHNTAVTGPDVRRWYDLTGIVVVSRIRAFLPRVTLVELPNDHEVRIHVALPQGGAEFRFDRTRVSAINAHQLLVNMVFFGGLMTVIAYLYLRNQLRPITRLAKAAEAFGRGRRVPYRPGGALEVRAAGKAFLDMRARIERQIEQRTLLLSGVSHDLRTPLTRLKLSLAFLDDEDREPMERDVEDMQRMLDGFLSFSKGTGEITPEKVDPNRMIAQLVEDCKRAQQDVTLFSAEGSGTVMVRPVAIRRAVSNLIENAVRYGNRAEVSVKLTDQSLRIRVEDDGPGIPANQRQDAVKPFNRLDAARNQNQATGVGLGLAITNDIARAHGGTLRLTQSDRLGGLCADIVIST